MVGFDQCRGTEEFAAHLGATGPRGRLGDEPPNPCSVSMERMRLEFSLCSEGSDAPAVRPVSIGSQGGSAEGPVSIGP